MGALDMTEDDRPTGDRQGGRLPTAGTVIGALVVGAVVAGALGLALAGGDDEPPATPLVELRAGPPLLPPTDPLDLVPVQVDQDGREGLAYDGLLGSTALYGDPDLDDPFTGPWLLVASAVGNDGSGAQLPAGVGGDGPVLRGRVEPDGHEWRSWAATDDPETLYPDQGIVLGHGLDDAIDEIRDGATLVRRVGPVVVIDPATLPPGVELLAESSLDVVSIATHAVTPAGVPSASWRDGITLSITSLAPDDALELLVRAVLGGATAGTPRVPLHPPADDHVVVLDHVGDALVLAHSSGATLDDLRGVVDDLEPAGDDAWGALEERFRTAPEPSLTGSGATVVQLPLDDGRVTASSEVHGPDRCQFQFLVSLGDRDSAAPNAGVGAGCEGWQVMGGRAGGQMVVVGDAPPTVATVSFELDDGTVVDAETTVGARMVFAVAVPAGSRLVAGEARAGDGTVLHRLLEPFDAGPPGSVSSATTGPAG